MNQNEIPHDPLHLGVPSGVSKMIYDVVVCSAQTMRLSCVKTSTISKRTESSIHLSLVTYEYHQVRPKWFLSLWYVRHKPYTYLASRLALYQTNWTKHPLEPRHLGEPSSASKTIAEPVVRLAQIVHQSCVKIRIISKQIESSIHLSLVTKE
jgi:hypothetical protein